VHTLFSSSPLLGESANVGRKKAFSPQKHDNMAEKQPFPFHFISEKRRFSMFIGSAEVFALVAFSVFPVRK
jgi:hypothetical protein